ncbi:Acetyltransferase (GNAT) family protein [anaerobic digester metagenome]
MVRIIQFPRIVPAAGTPPKRIEEYVGRIISGTSNVSIARMISPPGWSEPYQIPEFEEYTIVLSGILQVEAEGHCIQVQAGQAVIMPSGIKVRYSTPEGAEYIAVCTPAFSPDIVNREMVINDYEIQKITKPSILSTIIFATGPEEIDQIEDLWVELRRFIQSKNHLFVDRMNKVKFHERKQEILERNASRNLRIFFASDEISHKNIGYCLCSVASDSYGEIESIFICEEARNQGIGTKLMTQALSWMKEEGGTDIRVHVTVGNEDVIGFYKKFGLRPRQYILSCPEEK